LAARSKGLVSKTTLKQGSETAACSNDSNEFVGVGRGVCSIVTFDAVSISSRTYLEPLDIDIMAEINYLRVDGGHLKVLYRLKDL
jgi:hypothetical protein